MKTNKILFRGLAMEVQKFIKKKVENYAEFSLNAEKIFTCY